MRSWKRGRKRRRSTAVSYGAHLNQYNVIYLDITGFISAVQRQGISLREVPNIIVETVRNELFLLDPELLWEKSFTECLIRHAEKPNGRTLIFIIDEWDAIIREAANDKIAQKAYLNLLREWFKNSNFTSKAVAVAYMTGILPIKKDGAQSAISDFQEYSILNPGQFAEFTGFTEREVRRLCKKKRMDFEEVKFWYNGYNFFRK